MEQPNEMGMGDDGMEMESESTDKGTFYLPEEFPGCDTYKVGDTITLKVVSKDAESGELEVACDMGGEEPGNWKSDLRSSMSEPTEE